MRIASLVPSATEMLFALGLGESVVAVTHECDHPAEARSLPNLTRTVLPDVLSAGEIDAAVKAIVGEGRALYALDEERLAELAPDLIVTQAVCDVCAVSYEEVVEVASPPAEPSTSRPAGPEHARRDAGGRDPTRRGGRGRGAGPRAARRAGGEARCSRRRRFGSDVAAGDRAGVARPALRRWALDPRDDLDRRRRGRRRAAGTEVTRGRLG